jgi:hypothetical protein
MRRCLQEASVLSLPRVRGSHTVRCRSSGRRAAHVAVAAVALVTVLCPRDREAPVQPKHQKNVPRCSAVART